MDKDGELHTTITEKKFSNIKIENFPNVGKDVPGQAEEAFRTLN